MTVPDDKRRNSPADRFRNIMSAEQGKDGESTSRTYPKSTGTPVINLPRPNGGPDGERHAELAMTTVPVSSPPPRGTGMQTFLPAFWTVASLISLLFNVALLVLVVGLLRSFGSIDAASIGGSVLGGLYNNFERMDQAHIQTTVPLQTNIPLDLNIPVQTTTGITLAKDVSIPGAHVRINTPLFNIDAPANVTLPAGTSMDVTMGFSVPVQAQVPINLSVPVDIPLRKTELHPALVGLQDTIRPIYCMLNPLAQNLNAQPICK